MMGYDMNVERTENFSARNLRGAFALCIWGVQATRIVAFISQAGGKIRDDS